MSTDEVMKFEHFEACLDRYGADLDGWPKAARVEGRRLLERSAEAQSALASSLALAKLLDQAPTIEPSEALLRKVAEIPLRHPRPTPGRSSWWPFETLYRPALALAAAALLGIVTGGVTSDGWSLEAASLQTSGDDTDFAPEELDELTQLTFALHLENLGEGELP